MIKIDLVSFCSLSFPLILLIYFGFSLEQITAIEYNCFYMARSTENIFFLEKINQHKKNLPISDVFSERKNSEGRFEALVVYQFVI